MPESFERLDPYSLLHVFSAAIHKYGPADLREDRGDLRHTRSIMRLPLSTSPANVARAPTLFRCEKRGFDGIEGGGVRTQRPGPFRRAYHLLRLSVS